MLYCYTSIHIQTPRKIDHSVSCNEIRFKIFFVVLYFFSFCFMHYFHLASFGSRKLKLLHARIARKYLSTYIHSIYLLKFTYTLYILLCVLHLHINKHLATWQYLSAITGWICKIESCLHFVITLSIFSG